MNSIVKVLTHMDEKGASKMDNVYSVMKEAKELGLNASKAAEAGIEAAVREEKGRRWLEENREAIKAHNRRIEREGVLLPPAWLDEI